MTFSEETLNVLVQNCAHVIHREELRKKLQENRPLKVKLGVDPTAPDIHLGHTVGLTKLKQFQDLGHQAILIIGDFTAMIGDPSGRSATRPRLTHEEVMANARTYEEQAFKILDKERTQVVFNGTWFRKMPFEEVIQLNSQVTLQQMLQREDFKERVDQGIPVYAHEIQYPIMQGWDSVMIQADVELGGTDQLFNILVGRDLQSAKGQSPQVAMLLPILEGLDGIQKMSKSLGNAVGVTEPPKSMFGKLMSIPDALLTKYYALLLNESLDESIHPMNAKKELARRIVAKFHNEAEGIEAEEDFTKRFSERNLEQADLPLLSITEKDTYDLQSLVVHAYQVCFQKCRSRSDVRRLIEQGSVQWNGEKMKDLKAMFSSQQKGVLRLDKTHAIRLNA